MSKLEKAAKARFGSNGREFEAFLAGAFFARKEALRLFRSVEAVTIPMYIDGGERDGDIDPEAVADWLEKQWVRKK